MTKTTAWTRRAAEGLLIVASILLAFGLQAWWEDQVEYREETRLLQSILGELRANQGHLVEAIQYQSGIHESVQALLDAAANPTVDLSRDSVDVLIGGVSWYSTTERLQTAAVDAVVLGGTLSVLSDEILRTDLTAWLQALDRFKDIAAQDHETYFHAWLPFLRANAYLPQISNVLSEPGSSDPYYGIPVPVLAEPVDHRALVANREFQNLLVQKRWVADDILNEYGTLAPTLEQLVARLSASVEAR